MAAVAAPQSKSQALFENQASHAMQQLREAFCDLVEGLPQTAHRAVDLEKGLKLSRTLAWQIHRVATCSNPLAAAAHVPGAGAFRQVVRAARSAGVSDDRLRRATEAMQSFEQFVKEHAGDRATFATMIDGLAGSDGEGIDLKTRREAFRMNSRAWGVQVKTFLACGIIHPGRDASAIDMVLLRGLREVRRLRPGPPLRLSSQRVVDSRRAATQPRSVDDAGAKGVPVQPNLLLDFCTKPCPSLDTRVEDGVMHTFLRETPLGNAGVQTLYLADRTCDIAWQSSSRPNHHLRTASIMKPIEVLVLDTMIHRGMFGTLTPSVRVLGSLDRLGETDPYEFGAGETLPIQAEVEHLGCGPGLLPTPHVPRYREMIEAVCREADWDASEFEMFRCVVEYPFLNTTVEVRFDLPQAGAWQ